MAKLNHGIKDGKDRKDRKESKRRSSSKHRSKSKSRKSESHETRNKALVIGDGEDNDNATLKTPRFGQTSQHPHTSVHKEPIRRPSFTRDKLGRPIFPPKASTPEMPASPSTEPDSSPSPASEDAVRRQRMLDSISFGATTPKKRKYEIDETPQKRRRDSHTQRSVCAKSEDPDRKAEIKKLMDTIKPLTKAGRSARKEACKKFDDELERMRLQERPAPRTPRKFKSAAKGGNASTDITHLGSSLSTAVHSMQSLIQRPVFHDNYLQSFVNEVSGGNAPNMSGTVEDAKKQFGTASLLCAMNGISYEELHQLLEQMKGSLQLMVPRVA